MYAYVNEQIYFASLIRDKSVQRNQRFIKFRFLYHSNTAKRRSTRTVRTCFRRFERIVCQQEGRRGKRMM